MNVRILKTDRHDVNQAFVVQDKKAVPSHDSGNGERYRQHWQVRQLVSLSIPGRNLMRHIWHSDSDSACLDFFGRGLSF